MKSFLQKDAIFITLTATATNRIKDYISKCLLLSEPSVIYVPTGQNNAYCQVIRCNPGDFSFFDYFIALLRSKKNLAKKMIIYCRNVKTVSALFGFFSLALEKEQFLGNIGVCDKRLFAMIHRSTAEESKARIQKAWFFVLSLLHLHLRWVLTS